MSEPATDNDLETLLEYLRDDRGFDFTGYKRASLGRRIARRMQDVGATSHIEYMQFLEANPGEFAQLFDTILINVTALFRDRAAWDYLAESVIPEILHRKNGERVRVWSAGCASGEEAYSLAVLFAEAMGDEAFRRLVKIYATDADEEALVEARHGRYRLGDLNTAMGEERAARFFDHDDGYGTFRQDLRQALIFGRHDLLQDPPISRVDLLTCRNTLMYFTAETQKKILAAFQFALAPSGYLLLGKSESLVARTDLFAVVDMRHRVFRKDSSEEAKAPGRLLGRPRAGTEINGDNWLGSAVEQMTLAAIVVDSSGNLRLANRQARAMFGVVLGDVGRPLRQLGVARSLPALASAIERSLQERRPLELEDMEWRVGSAQPEYLDVTVSPALDSESLPAVTVVFVAVKRYKALRDELESSQRELETAYEELQSAVEELETTNEELQSTNEELETTNEELQSTNEELETMNEELQSANEELESMNDVLRERTMEVDEANRFLGSILSSLKSGVVVVNRDMQVREWNTQAEELFGLRADEVVGTHFFSLDIGLPVDNLGGALREVLSGRAERAQETLPGFNRRGRPVDCLVTLTPMKGEDGAAGAILMIDAAPREG